MRFPFGKTFPFETVTLLRDSPGGTNAYGDPIESTTARIDHPLCLVAPSGSTEATDRGSEGVYTRWTVYDPTPGALHTDGIEIGGIVCRIDGEIGDWGTGKYVINASRAVGG